MYTLGSLTQQMEIILGAAFLVTTITLIIWQTSKKLVEIYMKRTFPKLHKRKVTET